MGVLTPSMKEHPGARDTSGGKNCRCCDWYMGGWFLARVDSITGWGATEPNQKFRQRTLRKQENRDGYWQEKKIVTKTREITLRTVEGGGGN